MKKNIILAVLSTIVVVFIILMFVGIAENKKEEAKLIKEPVKTFKETAKEQFMGECVSEGLYAYCGCSFDTIYDELGINGFIDLSTEYEETQVLPDEILDMIAPCFELVVE